MGGTAEKGRGVGRGGNSRTAGRETGNLINPELLGKIARLLLLV